VTLLALVSNTNDAVKEHSIEISVKGKWLRVPALRVNGKDIIVRGKWLKTAVIDAEEWLETELEDPERCVTRLHDRQSHGLRADLFTFTQKLPSVLPKHEYFVEWDSVAAADTTSLNAWWENLPQETRKNVRKSQKRGVVVEVRELDDALIAGIMSVNNDSPVRQRIPFAHYGKTFDQVKKDQSSFPGRSDFICAYLGDELIGFLKLIYRGEVASILQLLPKPSQADKRPANALVAKAVELCEAKGVKYLTYGMFNYGNKGDNPLREFKVRNGFSERLVPRFYVPLTMKGALCMRVGLHRGVGGVLPHAVITLAVGARAKWYRLKLWMSRCSSVTERPNRNRQTECSNPPAGSKV
jgi:hypothetical protein